MKQKPDPDQKDEQKEVDITQLTGSPDPNGVSKVAMGGKSHTLMEHDNIQQAAWIDRLKGMPQDKSSAMQSIQEAYAKLFEGLAGIARMSSGEEACEPDDSPQEEQAEA